MKFKLKTLLAVLAFVAVFLALLISRVESNRRNLEAAELASELYRKHLLRELEKPYGSFFPPGWTAIVHGQGDVIDLTKASGRAELLTRIEDGRTNFRVRCASGQIMGQDELLTEPYPIYFSSPNASPRLFSSNTLFGGASDNHTMQPSGEPVNWPDRSLGSESGTPERP